MVFQVPEWKDKVAFQSCGGDSSIYAREMLMTMITPHRITEWKCLGNYEGCPNGGVLLMNAQDQLEFLWNEKFARFQDCEKIC